MKAVYFVSLLLSFLLYLNVGYSASLKIKDLNNHTWQRFVDQNHGIEFSILGSSVYEQDTEGGLLLVIGSTIEVIEKSKLIKSNKQIDLLKLTLTKQKQTSKKIVFIGKSSYDPNKVFRVIMNLNSPATISAKGVSLDINSIEISEYRGLLAKSLKIQTLEGSNFQHRQQILLPKVVQPEEAKEISTVLGFNHKLSSDLANKGIIDFYGISIHPGGYNDSNYSAEFSYKNSFTEISYGLYLLNKKGLSLNNIIFGYAGLIDLPSCDKLLTAFSK